MLLACKSCAAPIESLAIDRYDGHGRCPSCDMLNDFSSQLNVRELSDEARAIKAAGELPARCHRDGDTITILWRPSFQKGLPVMIGMLLFFSLLLQAPFALAKSMPLFLAIVLSLPFTLVPIMGWYVFLSSQFNRTTIKTTREGLQISYGPIWWPAPQDLTPRNLVQLYTNAEGKMGPVLRIKTKRHDRPLLPVLNSAEECLALEGFLEKQLGVHDNKLGIGITRAAGSAQTATAAGEHCQSCGAKISVSSIDRGTGKATCAQCGHVSSFAGNLGLTAPTEITDQALAEDYHLSNNQHVYREGADWVFESRADRQLTFLLLPFGIGAMGFTIAIIAGLLKTDGAFSVIATVFALPMMLLPALLGYWIIGMLINRTIIRVSPTKLERAVKPLRFKRPWSLEHSEIRDIIFKEVGRDHQIFAINQRGREVPLIFGVDSKESAVGLQSLLRQACRLDRKKTTAA